MMNVIAVQNRNSTAPAITPAASGDRLEVTYAGMYGGSSIKFGSAASRSGSLQPPPGVTYGSEKRTEETIISARYSRTINTQNSISDASHRRLVMRSVEYF